MKNRRRTADKREGEICGAADFHGERILQEEAVEAKNQAANRPQGTYEYEQMVAENAVFNPKQLISEAAFFIAEGRDFAPGHELADWLEAEAEIETRLGHRRT